MCPARPITIHLAGSPVAIRFSSLRVYQCSLGLAALSLVLAGWLFGSGLLALRAMFLPSVEISRSAGASLPRWGQERLRTDIILPSSAERWTTMNSGYAGITQTGIHTGKKGADYE